MTYEVRQSGGQNSSQYRYKEYETSKTNVDNSISDMAAKVEGKMKQRPEDLDQRFEAKVVKDEEGFAQKLGKAVAGAVEQDAKLKKKSRRAAAARCAVAS